MKKIPYLLLLLISYNSFGQGIIRGKIYDNETGEQLIGANILIEGTTKGAMTDLDGAYSIEGLEPGIYNVVCSYISYEKKNVEGVEVKDGEVTLIDFKLGTASVEIDNVVIQAKSIKNTESALLTIQKKSANVIDGISSQSFAKSGDGDAAAAIKRVTGVSVQDGSYVYVRGLGDRYTKTILNGMEIPGLDPDRNTVQMDLFPTNLIDNLIVYKTFTPDLPGDFTGGAVDIATKDFPERKTITASASFSYNPGMHFNNAYVLYDESTVDHFALGKRARNLPLNTSSNIPNPVLGDPDLTDLTESFSKQMAVQRKDNFLDHKYSFGMGNQFNKNKRTYGYNFALNYKSVYKFYESVEFGEYWRSSNPDVYELERLRGTSSPFSQGAHNVQWSTMLGGAMKTGKNKYSINLLHIQDGASSAARITQDDDFLTGATLIKDNLTYTQRSVSNLFVAGEHELEKVQVEWKNALTYSNISDPDLRTTAFALREQMQNDPDPDTTLNRGDGAKVNRIWRDLNEINESVKIDLTYEFKQWNGIASKLKFGIANTYKWRDYGILTYNFLVRGISTFNGDPDWLFHDDNIWMPESDNGTYVEGNIEPANQYTAMSNVVAIYAMNELPLHEKVKAIYGVRIEKADQLYTGQNNSGMIKYNNEHVLNAIDFLPSFNLVYSVIDNMNLRGSYTMTVARPSFRENSIAQIYDPVQDRTYIGGLSNSNGLEETKIHNVDLRWEYFFNRGEVISVSGFYKKFINPIEIVAFNTNPSNVQPRNVGDGMVYGAELEVRKNFGFIHEKLKDLAIGSNLTYVRSQIEMSDEEYYGTSTGGGGKLESARTGETVSNTRVMLGQSPYIINAFIDYSSDKIGFDANISYNVQGKRLAVVGSGRVPDVFELPFHSLNFKVSQKVGKEKRFKISFSAENLLADDKVWVYQSFKSSDKIYERYVPGREFTLGFSYTMK